MSRTGEKGRALIEREESLRCRARIVAQVHICQKRPMYTKKRPTKENYVYDKRDLQQRPAVIGVAQVRQIFQKRPIYDKETCKRDLCVYEKSNAAETYWFSISSLLFKHDTHFKRDLYMTKRLAKETYVYMKREIQLRPTDSRYHRRYSGTTNISKETYIWQRDLQKRPTAETYWLTVSSSMLRYDNYFKRDLYMWKETDGNWKETYVRDLLTLDLIVGAIYLSTCLEKDLYMPNPLNPLRTCSSATHCNALQHTATHCNTLRYISTHVCRETPVYAARAASWNPAGVETCPLKTSGYQPRLTQMGEKKHAR